MPDPDDLLDGCEVGPLDPDARGPRSLDPGALTPDDLIPWVVLFAGVDLDNGAAVFQRAAAWRALFPRRSHREP